MVEMHSNRRYSKKQVANLKLHLSGSLPQNMRSLVVFAREGALGCSAFSELVDQ